MGLVVSVVCIVGYHDPPVAAALPGSAAQARGEAGAGPAGRPAGESAGGDARAAPLDPPPARLARPLAARPRSASSSAPSQYSTLAHLVLYTKVEYLFGAVTAGLMLALCQASGAVGKPLAGFVSDRRFGGLRRPALLAMTGVHGLVCLVLALTGGLLGWGVYVAVAALGFGAIGWGGVFATAAGEIGGALGAGRVSGFTAAGVNIGGVFGPPLFGLAVDARAPICPRGSSWPAPPASRWCALACGASRT